MCGIAGVISRDPQLIDPRFADAQLHRGPDQQGVFFGDGEQFAVHSSLDVEPSVSRIALIHHRLSIIDLSELGRQPMAAFIWSITVKFTITLSFRRNCVHMECDLRRELIVRLC